MAVFLLGGMLFIFWDVKMHGHASVRFIFGGTEMCGCASVRFIIEIRRCVGVYLYFLSLGC